MTQALAWPVMALIIVLLLRRPIVRVLEQRPPKMLKAGPFEVEWETVVAATEAEVPAPAPKSITGGAQVELSAEARTAPAVAVLEAHTMIERTLREILVAADVPSDELRRAGSAVGLARLARRLGLIPDEAVRAVQGVSVLRNLAAHGSAREITPDQAAEYLALVDAVLFSLRTPPTSTAS